MSIQTASSYKHAAASAFVDMLNSLLGSSAKLQFFTGSPPANPEDSATGTMVAECDMSSTPFVYTVNEFFEANAVADDSDTDAGTVGYFRIIATDTTCFMQGVCADDASEDFDFDSLIFSLGDTLAIDSIDCSLILSP